jgi:undecaprenyl-phosphate 4-deoxy-4-formamido-L-arabinose transferase
VDGEKECQAVATEREGISVVVPVYNGVGSLQMLVWRLINILEEVGLPFEIILVNDGSRDESWPMIRGLAAHDSRVFGLNMMRNFGQHNALLAGIRTAQYAITVTMDDDLQHPPEEIPKLLEKLGTGLDVVYGVPARLPHAPWRNLTSWMMKRVLLRAMGLRQLNYIGAFRAFRTRLRRAFEQYQSPSVSIDVLLTWGTNRFGWVKVRHDPRRIGQSGYTFKKLVRHAVNISVGFSSGPLRLASFVGFAFTLVGLGVFIYVVVRTVLQGSIPGFPFLASIIAIFSGAQLFALGIIGEYIAVIHARLLDRPVYVVGDHAKYWQTSSTPQGSDVGLEPVLKTVNERAELTDNLPDWDTRAGKP